MSALLTAAVTGGASLLGSIFSSIFGAKSAANLNIQNRRWQEQMYSQQLQDSIDMWNEQNAYNSPVQQMQRLKEAGLNPNLIYSNNANMPAGSLTAPSPGSPSTTVPQLDLSGLFQFADFMQRAALQDSQLQTMDVQRDAMNVQIDETLAKINNLIAQNGLLDEQTKATAIENNLSRETFPDKVRQIRNMANLTAIQTELGKLDVKEREIRVNEILPLQVLQLGIQNKAAEVGIKLSSAQISNLAATTQNLFKQGHLLDIDLEWQRLLRQNGIDPHSPWYITSLANGGLSNLIIDLLNPTGSSRSLGGINNIVSGIRNGIINAGSKLPGPLNIPFKLGKLIFGTNTK